MKFASYELGKTVYDKPMICDQSEFLVSSLLKILHLLIDHLDPSVSQSPAAYSKCILKPQTVGCWRSENCCISEAGDRT